MRENTRCEVDEPMSTPTLRTTISSSSTSERPVLEKKMRPPTCSSVLLISGCDSKEASVDFQTCSFIVLESCNNFRMAAQPCLDLRSWLVTASQPDHFGRGTKQARHLREVSIKRDKHKSIIPSILPDCAIVGLCQSKQTGLRGVRIKVGELVAEFEAQI